MTIKKITFLSFLSFACCNVSFAQQDFPNSQLKVSANILPGCSIITEDFHFGELTIAKSNFTQSNIKLQCSKNSVITLSQTGLWNKVNNISSGKNVNRLTLRGDGVQRINESINYNFSTIAVSSNADFSIINKPHQDYWGEENLNSPNNYYLIIKTITGNSFELPIIAQASTITHYAQSLGDYSDTVTYSLKF